MDTTLIATWTIDYYCSSFWREFKREWTVNAISDRNLLQGLLREPFECTEERRRLVTFIQLIVCLADGQDVDIRYSVEQDITPLENALLCFEKLMAGYRGPFQSEVESMRSSLKMQAVLVCFKANNRRLAKKVFHRLWDRPTEATPAPERDMYAIQLNLQTYKDFLTSTVPLLESVFSKFPKPFLCLMADRYRQKQAAAHNDDDSSSVAESSARSEEPSNMSPIKGFRNMKRSFDEVMSQMSPDGDSNGAASGKRGHHHASSNGATTASGSNGRRDKLDMFRGKKCCHEVLLKALSSLGLSEADAGLGQFPEELQQKRLNRINKKLRKSGAPSPQPLMPQSLNQLPGRPTTSTPKSLPPSTPKSLPPKLTLSPRRSPRLRTSPKRSRPTTTSPTLLSLEPTPSPRRSPSPRSTPERSRPTTSTHKSLPPKLTLSPRRSLRLRTSPERSRPTTTSPTLLSLEPTPSPRRSPSPRSTPERSRSTTTSTPTSLPSEPTPSPGPKQRPRSTPERSRPTATSTPTSLSPEPTPSPRRSPSPRTSPEGSTGQRSSAVITDSDQSLESDPCDGNDVYMSVPSDGESSPAKHPQGEKAQGNFLQFQETPPRRGKSIRDKKYLPNRVAETGPDKPGPSVQTPSSDDSDSTSSWPSLATPAVRRSLDPRHWDGNRGDHALRKPIRKKPWTKEECQNLTRAVREVGVGNWSRMLACYDFNDRTNVNLKDKWRNMVKSGEVAGP